MKIRYINLPIIFFALLVSACTGSNPSSTVDLEDHTWVLTDLNGIDPLDGHRPTLEFKANQVTGNTGCNHYGGSYHIEGDTIRIEDLFYTEMACLDPAGIMEQETAFLSLLQSVGAYTINGNNLTLQTGAGKTLIQASAG